MPLAKDFVMKGFWPPTIFKSMLNGQSYAVSGGNWVEIDDDVTLAEVHKTWKKPVIDDKRKDNEWKVIGSKGDEYTVRLTNNRFSCDCQGFGWKRRCSHIDKIQAKLDVSTKG